MASEDNDTEDDNEENNDEKYGDLKSVREDKEEVPVEFDISISPSDPTLENLHGQIDRNDIIIPDYQRKFVWNMNQSSRLIESFLMGLPVPQVFLYVNQESQLEIIDGQQRLLSIYYFLDGFFDKFNNVHKHRKFKLKGLKNRPEYNGKAFVDLSDRDQRRLRNMSLRAINIKQIYPDKHNNSVFHIFERLNTGGTNLKPQEIRNAIYRGEIVTTLRKLNDNPHWRKMLGMEKPDRSERDVELLLRVFSLFHNWNEYEGPMLRHLNKTQDKNRDFDSDHANAFLSRFPQAAKLLSDAIEKPFQPSQRVNTAVLDSVMVAVMENTNLTQEQIKTNYPLLLESESFGHCIVGGTADKGKVTLRHEIARDILNDGTH